MNTKQNISKIILTLILISSVLFSSVLFAQENKNFKQDLENFINQTLTAFEVPGVSVTIVKDSIIVLTKGYGTKNINTKEKVDSKTIFAIASNTKAFTAAAMAILVDEGKINWDDKVIDYLPDFQMYDPYVTREFTIKDLLSHHSGLSIGKGDLMLWPQSTFTRKEVVKNLRYLKPSTSFRTRFSYSNLHYVTAGEVIEAVTGTTWENFVREKILKPLGMNNTYMGVAEIGNVKNIATPHIPVEGKIQAVKIENTDVCGAAASMLSNAEDISKWLMLQLNKGKIPNTNKHLFSKMRSKEMWTPITIQSGKRGGRFPSTFSAYGLGWGIRDYNGKRIISHTGGYPGMISKTTLVPEIGLGIVVYTNQQSGATFNLITNYILEHYFNLKHKGNIEKVKEAGQKRLARINKMLKEQEKKRNKNSLPSLKLEKYTGTYKDIWYGKIVISMKENALFMNFLRSPGLKGKISHWQYNTFLVRWNDRTINADCFINFNIDEKGEIKNFTMKPISPLTDFSYDFHDLEFYPVKEKQ